MVHILAVAFFLVPLLCAFCVLLCRYLEHPSYSYKEMNCERGRGALHERLLNERECRY